MSRPLVPKQGETEKYWRIPASPELGSVTIPTLEVAELCEMAAADAAAPPAPPTEPEGEGLFCCDHYSPEEQAEIYLALKRRTARPSRGSTGKDGSNV